LIITPLILLLIIIDDIAIAIIDYADYYAAIIIFAITLFIDATLRH
jgi:hypothetical protein